MTEPTSPIGSNSREASDTPYLIVITADSSQFGELKREQSVLDSQVKTKVLSAADDESNSMIVCLSHNLSGTADSNYLRFEFHSRKKNTADVDRST